MYCCKYFQCILVMCRKAVGEKGCLTFSSRNNEYMSLGFPGITCLAFSTNYGEIKLFDLGIAISAGKHYLTILSS